MHYEIWDVATGNCIGRYTSEHAALTRVKELLSQFGDAYVDELELAAEDDLGNFQGARTGSELDAWVEAALAEQPATSTA